MLIQCLTEDEIELVSGGALVEGDWRIVPPSLWAEVYGDLAYPDIPPKYRDSDPATWVYD